MVKRQLNDKNNTDKSKNVKNEHTFWNIITSVISKRFLILTKVLVRLLQDYCKNSYCLQNLQKRNVPQYTSRVKIKFPSKWNFTPIFCSSVQTFFSFSDASS